MLAHVWQGGADALDEARVAALVAALAPQRDPGSEEVKAELRAMTEDEAKRFEANLYGSYHHFVEAMVRHLANSHERFMASWQAEGETPARPAARKKRVTT